MSQNMSEEPILISDIKFQHGVDHPKRTYPKLIIPRKDDITLPSGQSLEQISNDPSIEIPDNQQPIIIDSQTIYQVRKKLLFYILFIFCIFNILFCYILFLWYFILSPSPQTI